MAAPKDYVHMEFFKYTRNTRNNKSNESHNKSNQSHNKSNQSQQEQSVSTRAISLEIGRFILMLLQPFEHVAKFGRLYHYDENKYNLLQSQKEIYYIQRTVT